MNRTCHLTLLLGLALFAGCATGRSAAELNWPLHTLSPDQITFLNLPDHRSFDASALLLLPSGELLTLRDTGPTVYRVGPRKNDGSSDLHALTNAFTVDQLKSFASEKHTRYDCEGLARDDEGRIYICEEADRWILRWDPKTSRVERLPIDWSSVQEFFSADRNASFEGIAIGDGKMYVANERSSPVIIVVDLASLKVIDHFVVVPRSYSFLNVLHYSDLCWFEGNLWVLCRQHRAVLQVDAAKHAVLAEFNYQTVEDNLGYQTDLPVGVMEGLAVERDVIWLCTDNNGLPRRSHPKDIRPALIRCARPDRKPARP